jgi:hypothetical protein
MMSGFGSGCSTKELIGLSVVHSEAVHGRKILVGGKIPELKSCVPQRMSDRESQLGFYYENTTQHLVRGGGIGGAYRLLIKALGV